MPLDLVFSPATFPLSDVDDDNQLTLLGF
jgi:hypothetical protein